MTCHPQRHPHTQVGASTRPSLLHALAIAAAVLMLQAAGMPAARAQGAPDAGQILQQLKPVPEAPRPGPALQIQAPTTEATLPGGVQVQLRAIEFGGNTVIDSARLQQLLADATGHSLDLAGLRALADRVGTFYREAGYLFARAYLPPQTLRDGVLRIEVVEGRYGQIRAQADEAPWGAAAQAYLARLQPGSVIEGPPLERATLLLGDLPGVRITPVIQPGTQVGTGDVVVAVVRGPAFSGNLGLDNHGNRYSGKNRLVAALDWNSPWRMGDQLSLRSVLSDHKLWLGSLAYGAPLGSNGLRGSVSHAHTSYELGKEFAALGATGTARVSSLGLSYPLQRSNRASLRLSVQLQRKRLRDQQAQVAQSKTAQTLPLALDFDRRDDTLGGGLSFGSLSFTPGKLKLPAAQVAGDSNETRGHFRKLNLDLVRLQSLPGALSAYGRFSAQRANKNLDSSERISLGGAAGVRAYPSGEGTGDQGWLLQAELRLALGAVSPYAFVDTGSVRINANPTPQSGNNQRDLAGAGLGLRGQIQRWDLNAALAWRTRGGAAQADGGKGGQPRVWVNAGYAF